MTCNECGGVIQPNDETWPSYPCECCPRCRDGDDCFECSKCLRHATFEETVRINPGEFKCIDCHADSYHSFGGLL